MAPIFSRSFANSEKSAQSETTDQVATTELEKKLLADVEELQTQVSKLTEKSDELLVS